MTESAGLKNHVVIAFSDTEKTKRPLLGVIYCTIGVDPINADEWLEQRDNDVTADGDAMMVLNTHTGAMVVYDDRGLWRGDVSELPEILAGTSGWSPNE